MPTSSSPPAAGARYDPYRDLATNWPEIVVVVEPMTGWLLGELRYPVMALRAGTSAPQRRCTLTHELVHLERGVRDCGTWSAREERNVHREVARRLVTARDLGAAIRGLGGAEDLAALAQALDVDVQTARLRLELVTPQERASIHATAAVDLWQVS